MKIRFWPSFLVFLAAASGFSLPAGPAGPLENDEARTVLRDLILAGVGEILEAPQRIIHQRRYAHRVQFQVEIQGDSVYLVFRNERDGQFPMATEGNVVIRRGLGDGAFQQIKIFYRNHPDCYLRILPRGDRSSMEVVLFGRTISSGLILPVSCESLLLAPLARIMRLSAGSVDWALLRYRGEAESDRRLLELAADLRGALASLRDAEDGALDADGRLVQIRDLQPQEGPGGLNCSGFAKWVADGFLRPLTGGSLKVAEMKVRHPDLRGNRWSERLEEERDPYFGLDWSRNLAAGLMEARLGARPGNAEHADVRQVEFLRYIEDVGYRMEDLELLLFVLATRDPGHLYIGSINTEFGRDPALRQHFHLVVLIPYFLPDGTFRVAVFERNQETGFGSLARRYPGHFIHLVRLDGLGDFDPPPLPAGGPPPAAAGRSGAS